ncbi:MAG: hypothetical protein HY885_18510 [Deltaproteobacteria bacterium]|nr:hypothetical protein [Deltaproteobacteria bacterium]
MAEIRSTLEMVLERAARMEAQATGGFSGQEKEKEGMRLAAGFLRGEQVDLLAALQKCLPEARGDVKKGMVAALLRNIVLPRKVDEAPNAEKAMQALREIGRDSGDLAQVFTEMKSILDRYLSHRDQLKKQLEEQFAQQMMLMEKSLAQQTGMKMKLQPSQHPKFAEEWQRIQLELNDQYGRAVEQYKEFIAKHLAP